jgi:GTP-binding protein
VDDPFTPEAIEAARVLFARPCEFMLGAARVDQLPDADLPEVAFAGRSNVGKSSLINALVNQKKLARASNEPGRTRELNLFLLDGRVRLVDLPGYGWARADKKTAARFQNLGRQYLRGRPNLKRVYLLIDARHGLKSVDAEALDALDLSAVSYQIVLTKADKLRPAALIDKVRADTLRAIAKRPAAFPRVAATSSETGFGIPELRAEVMAAAVGFEALVPPSPGEGDRT